MGCSSPQNASAPNIPAHHLQRLLIVSDINHALNVNKKYQHLTKIQDGQMAGQGYKRTFAYDCLTTKAQLQAKRKEFWQTRVNGNPECWTAIHMAVNEPDQNVGMGILQQMRIMMLNNSIQMCVDSRFNKYQVPVFCLNEPMSYAHENLAQKNLNYQYEDTLFDIKIRSVKYPTEDIVVKEKASTEIKVIKDTIRVMKGLPEENIRLFYNGREMSDAKSLGNYNYLAGSVIQAMIR